MFIATELPPPAVLDDFLAAERRMLIGGEWVGAASGLHIDVEDPSTGRTIAQVLATARTPGRDAGLTAIGVFGAPRPGFEFTDVTTPEFPDAATLPSFRDPIPDDVEPVSTS